MIHYLVSGSFVFLITFATGRLGPQLSGLAAPFPVFVLILSVFTHRQMGSAAASNLARGVILGSFSFAAFFAAAAVGLPHLGLIAYAPAALASAAVSGSISLTLRHRPSDDGVEIPSE